MSTEFIELITVELARRETRNPSYSLRAFAKDLHVHPSALSELMNGKRGVTPKMGQHILEKLNYSAEEIDRMLNFSKELNADTNLSLEKFKTISNWYHFAILSLGEIPNFDLEPKAISERLNISEKDASEALDRLELLGMIVRDLKGKLIITGQQFKTPTEVVNVAVKKHNIQVIELAQNSLLNDPLEKRDFSTVTMTIDPADMFEAKKMMKEFRKKFCKKIESGKKKEVYMLSMQFFPLSKDKAHA